MQLPSLRLVAINAALCLVLAAPSRAGQVRVNVGNGGSLSFSPQNAALNQGDQVVWIWESGSHSVTEGSGCAVSSPVFNSGTVVGARFAWKSDRTGSVPYFCIPHCGSGMTGTLTISSSGVSVSDFRITEVRHTSNHSADFVEIANLGSASGNLGQYRLSIAAGSALLLPLVDIAVPAGGRVVVHLGQSGTSNATDIFFPASTLTAIGSAALFLPNTVATSLTDPGMMVDFVEWGAGAQPSEATAVSAGYWTAGQFAPGMPDGNSIEFCGTAANRGPASWFGIAVPNPGVNGNCTTPTETATWGQVKALYR